MVETNSQLPTENGATANGNGVGASPGAAREEKLQHRINQLLEERKEMEMEAEELVNIIHERDEEIRQLRLSSSSPPPPPQEHPPAPYEPAQQLQDKVKSLTKIIAKMQNAPTAAVSERLAVVRSLLEGCCEFVSGRSQRDGDNGWKEASSLLNEVHKAVTELTSESHDDFDSAGSAVSAAVKALGVLKSENANQTSEIVALKAELSSLKSDMSSSELLIKAQTRKIKALAAAADTSNDVLVSPRQTTPVTKPQGLAIGLRSTVLSRPIRESSYTRTPSNKKPYASPQASISKSRSPTIPIRRRLSSTFTPQGGKSPPSSTRHTRTGTA